MSGSEDRDNLACEAGATQSQSRGEESNDPTRNEPGRNLAGASLKVKVAVVTYLGVKFSQLLQACFVSQQMSLNSRFQDHAVLRIDPAVTLARRSYIRRHWPRRHRNIKFVTPPPRHH